MSGTNFAAQTAEEKLVWSRRTWAAARDKMFLKNIAGVGDNNPIHMVKELTKTEKGLECIFPLVADLVEDGNVGDGEREGHEEEMQSYWETIKVDLLNHGIRNKGKLADQATVLNVREMGRDRLSYWLANRVDQLAILTLSGIDYAQNLDGSLRPAKSKLKNLSFNSDVRAYSSKRSLTFNGTNLLVAGDSGFGTTAVTTAYVPKYKMIVDAGAYARTHRIKPLLSGGKEYYLMLVHPLTYAMLKMDDKFQNALVNAAQRGDNNPWFTGADVTVDGMIIKQHVLAYNTLGATTGTSGNAGAAGYKWGADANINGSRSIVMGAQALAMADLNIGDWTEKLFQYDSVWGINVDKMFGFLRPEFYSIYDGSVQDFGSLAIDHYLG